MIDRHHTRRHDTTEITSIDINNCSINWENLSWLLLKKYNSELFKIFENYGNFFIGFLKPSKVLSKFGKHFVPLFSLFSGNFVDEVISGRFWKNCN